MLSNVKLYTFELQTSSMYTGITWIAGELCDSAIGFVFNRIIWVSTCEGHVIVYRSNVLGFHINMLLLPSVITFSSKIVLQLTVKKLLNLHVDVHVDVTFDWWSTIHSTYFLSWTAKRNVKVSDIPQFQKFMFKHL